MKAIELFGNVNEPHVCCSCCDGYCPQWEAASEPTAPQLYTFVASDGVKYLTDRYIAIRADMIDAPSDEPIDASRSAGAFHVPASKPGPSRAAFTPRLLRQVLAAGLTVHHSDDTAQPLYRGDEFVGWIARRKDAEDAGMYLEAIERIEEYAAEVGRAGLISGLMGDEWGRAATILNEARRLSERAS